MQQTPPRKRRLWPVVVPFMLVVAIAVIWTGLWFYAASAAETAIVGWRAREAKSGRIFECATETIGGYPFGFELRCDKPSIEWRGKGPHLVAKGQDIVVRARVLQPTRLIAEFTGPMTLAAPGLPPVFEATWKFAQADLHGTPRVPERGAMVFDDPLLSQLSADGSRNTAFQARRLELDGRIAEGSVNSNPVVEVIVRTTAAAASPAIHPLAAVPFDANIAATLRGLADFAPKPWPVRFREIQARGGRIDITKARVQQGAVIAVSSGTLGLTERGNLNGQLEMTVVGLEQVLKLLDLEAIMSQGRVGTTIDRLDRLIPGLGGIARKHAAPGILAGLDAIGKRTELEGRPAVALPLRFDDGLVMLGPFPIGRTPPLF